MKQIIVDFGTLHLLGGEFPLRIYGYGLMLVLGFLTAIFLAQWRARRNGENPEVYAQVGLLAVIGGILGARLAYVIQHWEQFSESENLLGEMFNVTSGGLIYYGGLVMAALMVVGYLLLKKVPLRRYLDIVSVSIMVGLAFGRAGCLLNGCCYGANTDNHYMLGMTFPMYSQPLWKVDSSPGPFSAGTDAPSPVYSKQYANHEVVPPPELMKTLEDGRTRLMVPREFQNDPKLNAIAQAQHSHVVKPSQAIGIVNALLLAVILALFYRLRRREGQVFALLFILYPITRFFEELIRDDNAHDLAAGIFTHNQYTSMVLLAAGIVLMLVIRKLPASCGPAWKERLAMGLGRSSASVSPHGRSAVGANSPSTESARKPKMNKNAHKGPRR